MAMAKPEELTLDQSIMPAAATEAYLGSYGVSLPGLIISREGRYFDVVSSMITIGYLFDLTWVPSREQQFCDRLEQTPGSFKIELKSYRAPRVPRSTPSLGNPSSTLHLSTSIRTNSARKRPHSLQRLRCRRQECWQSSMGSGANQYIGYQVHKVAAPAFAPDGHERTCGTNDLG